MNSQLAQKSRYVPILLASDDKALKTESSDPFNSDRFVKKNSFQCSMDTKMPLLKQKQTVNEDLNSLSCIRRNSNKKYNYSINEKQKITVFPNILKQTKYNLKSYRAYELKRLDDQSIQFKDLFVKYGSSDNIQNLSKDQPVPKNKNIFIKKKGLKIKDQQRKSASQENNLTLTKVLSNPDSLIYNESSLEFDLEDETKLKFTRMDQQQNESQISQWKVNNKISTNIKNKIKKKQSRAQSLGKIFDFSIFKEQIQNKMLKKSIDQQQQEIQSRIELIRDQRNENIRRKKSQKKTIKLGEQEHIERLLIYEDVIELEDLIHQAFYDAQREALIEKNITENTASDQDPFSHLSNQDNRKFANIIKYVNIEKIMKEKNLSRQDVINYLSVFKSLMDSDNLPKLVSPQDMKQLYVPSNYVASPTKPIKTPKLYITLKQLRRALPYLALYRNTVNTKKLNEIYGQNFKCVSFMDFLDIFTYTHSDEGVGEAEILENNAFI